jgi:hypothetical protein
MSIANYTTRNAIRTVVVMISGNIENGAATPEYTIVRHNSKITLAHGRG